MTFGQQRFQKRQCEEKKTLSIDAARRARVIIRREKAMAFVVILVVIIMIIYRKCKW
jgi:cell division protein FtsL